MRLSTAITPRVIACAEELPKHIALPRGCRGDLEDLLREHGVALAVDDQRHEGEPVQFKALLHRHVETAVGFAFAAANLAVTLAKGSTTPVSTPSSWRCLFRGEAR